MGFGTVPFWHVSAPPRGVRRPIEPGASYDVAIVGGGFTGLWTAKHLLDRAADARIAIFEAHDIGYGASGRNAGVLTNWMGHSPGSLLQLGADVGRSIHRDAVQSVRDVVDYIKTNAIDCDLDEVSLLYVSSNAANDRRIRRDLDAAAALGDEVYKELQRRGAAPAHRLAAAVERVRGHRGGDREPGQAGPRPRRPPRDAGCRPVRAGAGQRRRDRRPGHPDHGRRSRLRGAGRAGKERLGRGGRAVPSPPAPVLRVRRHHRAAVGRAVGAARLGRAGARQRPAVLPHQLPADARRPAHVRRGRRPPALRRPGPAGARPGRGRLRRTAGRAPPGSSRRWPTCGSPSGTADRSP